MYISTPFTYAVLASISAREQGFDFASCFSSFLWGSSQSVALAMKRPSQALEKTRGQKDHETKKKNKKKKKEEMTQRYKDKAMELKEAAQAQKIAYEDKLQKQKLAYEGHAGTTKRNV